MNRFIVLVIGLCCVRGLKLHDFGRGTSSDKFEDEVLTVPPQYASEGNKPSFRVPNNYRLKHGVGRLRTFAAKQRVASLRTSQYKYSTPRIGSVKTVNYKHASRDDSTSQLLQPRIAPLRSQHLSRTASPRVSKHTPQGPQGLRTRTSKSRHLLPRVAKLRASKVGSLKGSKGRCRVVPLGARKNVTAGIIVSATVLSFRLSESAGPFAGKVKVRRIFRGPKDLEGRSVLVSGLGDHKICVSTPKLGDTKLFFLDEVDVEQKNYKLHSSILRVNLRNLKALWKIIKQKDCGDGCGYGGLCEEGRCVCHAPCPPVHNPLCAADGKTYGSSCLLERAECHVQKAIAPLKTGPCLNLTLTSKPAGGSCPPGGQFGEQCREPREVNQITFKVKPPRSEGYKITRAEGRFSKTGAEGGWSSTEAEKALRTSGAEGGLSSTEAEKELRTSGAEGGLSSSEADNGFMADRQLTSNSVYSEFGTLGNLCRTDKDCRAKESLCASSVCECKPGFIKKSLGSCSPQPFSLRPTSHRQTFSSETRRTGRTHSSNNVEPPGPCAFNPCAGGGTCEEHDSIFTCYCSPERSGKYCEGLKKEIIREASFSGWSYVSLKYLPTSVTRTTMEMEFKPYSANGIILLARQSEGRNGDYFSISLHRGHVEVRYNLGSGPVTLTSTHPVNLAIWNKLVVKRYRQDGMLMLNGGEVVTARAKGRNKSLNLKGYAYIGGFPALNTSSIEGMVAETSNFQGCIRDLQLRGRGVSLVSNTEPLLVEPHNIKDCSEHACSQLICKNGGRCTSRGDKARCACAKGFRGRRCHKKKKKKKKKRRRKKDRKRKKINFPFIIANQEDYRKYKYSL